MTIDVGEDVTITLTDDLNSDGRDVSVNATALESSLGYRPQVARGVNSESGEEWSSRVRYVDGSAVIDVPHFSTNTVTFSGEVSVTGIFTDGSNVNYDITSQDAVENLSVSVTGNTNTEIDTHSGSLSDGNGSVSISPSGTTPPSSANVSISTGPEVKTSPVDNLGDGSRESTLRSIGDDNSDNPYSVAVTIRPSESGSISEIIVPVDYASGSDYGVSVEVRIAQGNADSTFGDGTQVSTWDPDWTSGNQTINLDSSYSVTAGETYHIELISGSSDGDGSFDQLQLEYDDSATEDGFAVKDSSTSVYTNYGHLYYRIPGAASAVDATGDSTTSFGDIPANSTQTKTVDISGSTSSIDVSSSSSTRLDMEVNYTETTETVDPEVSVNGYNSGYTGTLSDGETVSLDVNNSWVKETNSVNISVGDGSLSSDAPTPRVDLDYRHTTEDKISVESSTYEWVTRYQFSREYATTQDSVSITVPLRDNVVNVTAVETSRNGSAWSTADYTLDDSNDLVIDAGTVDAGTNLSVRANTTLVKPVNGDITVEEPTLLENELNTLISVDSKSEGFGIEVGSTRKNTAVHHVTDTSWSAEDYSSVQNDGSQTLYLPGSAEGGTARVKTAPLVVEPDGGVEVVVEDATEPRFRLRQGSTGGSDSVSVTWTDAARDTDYSLWSITQERESRSAESDGTNVSFSIGDSTASYRIEESSSTTAAIAVGESAGTGPLGLPLDLLALLLGVGGTFVGLLLARRRFGLRGRAATYGLLGAGAIVSIVAIELVTPRSIVSDFAFSASRAFGLLGGGALDGFLSSGAGSIALGLSALIGLYAIDSRLLSLPRWLWIVAGGGITVWIVDTVTEGALASGLSEVSALAWLLIILGAIVLLWRALQPTQINIGGGNS